MTEGIGIGPPQRLSFMNIEELRQWVSDIEALVMSIVWVLDVHSSKLREILEAFFEQQTRGSPRLTPPSLEELSKGLTPGAMADLLHMADQTNSARFLFDHIFRQIMQARDIAQSVRSRLAQFDAAKKRRPMRVLITGLWIASFAFFCGVILPICWRNVPALFVLWIPSGFYIGAFTYVMWKIV